MDYLIEHPTWQDHSREMQLTQALQDVGSQGEEDPRGTGRIANDAEFVMALIAAIQGNQVQLVPRTGHSIAYMNLIQHLGDRAKDIS